MTTSNTDMSASIGTGIAVIKTGGKQYLVKEGSTIMIEKIEGLKKGDSVSFDSILLADDGKALSMGAPEVSKSKVEGTVLEVGRSPKVTVVKYKAKSRYFKKNGHRQPFLKVKIAKV